MLRSVIPLLRCPVCQSQRSRLEAHAFAEGLAGHIKDGALACGVCGSWYPIEDELLELVKPELLYQEDYAAFVGRFSVELKRLGFAPDSARSESDLSAQFLQRRHFDWYADNPEQTYNAYQNSPFWKAFDAATFGSWRRALKPGGAILDVGCADGRSCFQFINQGSTVVGMDISKALIRRAIERAAKANAQSSTSFFVADATALPLRDESVEYVVIYGVLHHVPDPAATCREAYRVLKPRGIYFGSENNATILRKVFDLLMKWMPIWREEAGQQALISQRNITEWLRGLPASLSCRSSVFLPPHLVNLFGRRGARVALGASDKLFHLIPGLRGQGGLIVFEVRK